MTVYIDKTIIQVLLRLFCLALFFSVMTGCVMNNPHPSEEDGENIYYSTFNEPPKHLDPAVSYSSDELSIIGLIYEPPLEYHYLKRPYTIIPVTLETLPTPVNFDIDGNVLPAAASPEEVHRSVYELTLKKGTMYQEHPAFVRDDKGQLKYGSLTDHDVRDIRGLRDFPETASRELVSDDYIYQIKRLADPRLHSPILSIMQEYILGLKEYSQLLHEELERIRAGRKKAAGQVYNRTVDEKANPIVLDYNKFPLDGVQQIDTYTYRIILNKKYPQFIYWLTMPFFAPMPEEAIRFYSQRVLLKKNITVDRYPIGTGAYRMETYDPNKEIIMVRNENYHEDYYPEEGDESDPPELLQDAGKRLPFIDRIVMKLEKEALPRWNKFLQGYYDASGISEETFDSVIQFSVEGEAELTDFMLERGIHLETAIQTATYYMGFNMLDKTVGRYGEKQKKLRKAISIALDNQEFIDIFANGRGIAAMSPLPPGIFGYQEGKEGINQFVYRWDPERKHPVTRSMDKARELLAEAGYPDGRDSEGKPLVITFDNAWTGPEFKTMIDWHIKRLKDLGIQLENRTTDYNRFQDKIDNGNFQLFRWGWLADYPDPENFFFLLTSANSTVKTKGPNHANYSNPHFDALYFRMKNMDNTPERLAIIKSMTKIIQDDAPWNWGYHPVSFTLHHNWLKNVKPHQMTHAALKYYRINTKERYQKRQQWNQPLWQPVAGVGVFVLLGIFPAYFLKRKRMKI